MIKPGGSLIVWSGNSFSLLAGEQEKMNASSRSKNVDAAYRLLSTNRIAPPDQSILAD
jgi:hypothetical protein